MASSRRDPKGKSSVPSATNLPQAAQDDQNRRMRQYLLSMGIRTVCFVAGVLLWGVNKWIAGACFVLATILPYIAVVLANATGKRKIDVVGSVPVEPSTHRAIPRPQRDVPRE